MGMFDEPYTCQDCGAECVGLSFWEVCSPCGTKRRETRMAAARTGRDYTIETLGGACPTQAEGRTNAGRPYYFRARHGYWTLEVGDVDWPTDYARWPHAESDWQRNEVACGSDDSNGWMDDSQVLAILDEHLAAS